MSYEIQIQTVRNGKWSNYDWFDETRLKISLEERIEDVRKWLPRQGLKEYRVLLRQDGEETDITSQFGLSLEVTDGILDDLLDGYRCPLCRPDEIDAYLTVVSGRIVCNMSECEYEIKRDSITFSLPEVKS